MVRGARLLGGLACAVATVGLLRASMVQVAGRSMEPALRHGTRLLTVPALGRLVRPDAIVVVEDPTDRGHLVVKRVHRVTGDTVDVRGDAPGRSTDSRQWGPLSRGSVRRVVVCRWPGRGARTVAADA